MSLSPKKIFISLAVLRRVGYDVSENRWLGDMCVFIIAVDILSCRVYQY